MKKVLYGLTAGLVLAFIVLNVDKKLWLPLELETINGRNTAKWLNHQKVTKEGIVLILFDDKTQFLLRQRGLPIKDFEKRGRDLIGHAIEILESYGVRSIGINLNLNVPSGTPSDENLSKTISKFKNIVIADSIHSFPSYGATNILRSSSSIGYGELYSDYDSIVHKIKLIERSYKDIPSFSYALFMLSSMTDVDEKLKFNNEFYLKYPQKDSFAKYSFIDLIQGKVRISSLRNKVVILGIGLKSKLMIDKLLSPSMKNLHIPDSEVQAAALSNLLSGNFLYKTGLNNYPLFFILLSTFLGILFSISTSLKRLIMFVAIFIGLIIFSQISYTYFQTIVEFVPLLFLLLGNIVIGSIIFLQLNLQQQNLELEDTLKMLSKRSKELNERVSELKEVRKQLSTKSEEERKRIARELHDDTLSRITDLKRYIESMMNSKDLSLIQKDELSTSIHTLDNVTSEIRRIINALRPSMLDNALGLIPAIENLLDELSKRSNFKIQSRLVTSLSNLRLSEEAEINLYRILQEALNNVYKHSKATKVEIFIDKQPGQVLILVSDNGIGLNINEKINKKGFGLVDMKERAELIGATIQHLNKPNNTGTTLEIAIPIEKIEKIPALSGAC